MRTAKRVACVWQNLLCAGLLISTVVSNAQTKAEKNAPVFRITESFYQEAREPIGRNADNPASEPQITTKGKVKIECMLPLNGMLPANFDSRCSIQIEIGNSKYLISSSDDPKWKAGSPGFTVAPAERNTGAGGNHVDLSGNVLSAEEFKPKVFGKARVRWNLERITVQMEGDIPGLTSPAAILYADDEPGKLDIDTTATIILSLGNTVSRREFDIKLIGDLKHTKRMNEPFATITTVEFKGEGKPIN